MDYFSSSTSNNIGPEDDWNKLGKNATSTSLKIMDNFSSSINNHKFHDLDNIGIEDDWKKWKKFFLVVKVQH